MLHTDAILNSNAESPVYTALSRINGAWDEKRGKGGTVRTCDMQSQSLLLFQLSYAPISWSPRQASNLHARGHLVLSQARLPIPPRGDD